MTDGHTILVAVIFVVAVVVVLGIVLVVVAAVDYNLICILWLGDFLHSHTYLLTNGLSLFNQKSSYLFKK